MPFWQNAIPLHSGVLTSQPFETSAVMSGTWSVMIKAVDTLGNYSAGVAYDIINLGPAIVDHLVYSANYYTQGWTGAKTNCFIDENGNLLANSPGTLMFSPNNNTPMFTSANAPMFSAQYGAITYVDSFKSPQAGQMSISLDCDGSAQIWYRSMYPQPMFTGANQPMFSGGANPMYTAGEWIPYTSKVAISSDTYQIMITISAGSLRPTIRTLTVNVDLPTVTESINSVAISASGTRLPITKVYNQILDINISIQSGSTSIGYQVIDYQTTIGAGPEIVLLNSSGVAVTGTVSVTIQGV
jgi:carbon monoxide dehydrogenase subunit G